MSAGAAMPGAAAARGWRRPGQAWLLLAVLLAAGAVLAWWLPANALDWQPARAAAEPWRAFSGALVHWSPLHLQANLAGTVAVGALGVAAGVPPRIALAWLAAWPLTQAGLLLAPELAHYGGLSGVLHAGAAAAALWIAVDGHGRRRALGLAVLGGIAVKLLLEEPWGAALRSWPGWDIAIAPLAHATGTIAGLAAATVALLLPSTAPTAR